MPGRNRLIGFVAAALLLVVLAPSSEVFAQAAATSRPPYMAESNLIEVMFAPDSRVRLRSGGLVDLATQALDGVDGVLQKTDGHEWLRICDVPEQRLDEIQARGEANTRQEVYNLNNIYRLRFESRSGAVDVWALSRELEALPGVLLARPVPLPMPLPTPPDFEPVQNYLDPATSLPTGIDARYAWTQTGGDGAGVTICDIEYSWNYNHDDVTKALNSQINVGVVDPFNDTNHGTAVIGEMVSDDNSPNWGTKGACYGAGLLTCGSYYGLVPSWNVAGAIAVAVANLSPGDVILLEQQWDYTGSQGYIPIEWWMDSAPNGQTFNGVYAAIANAVSNGIHVVEAGGNGYTDTDLLQWFGDSGAIIVGAGGAYPGGTWPQGNLERLVFSSFGSRFNLQGWGENVVTTGYGDLYNLEGANRYYTNTFAGTSSASPIVASAVACCAGYYLANISTTPLPPAAMRNLLVSTGTPQVFGLPGNIGPRPDCRAAIAMLAAQVQYDWGDAPEMALAYPPTGIIGTFPTCATVGSPGSFVRHGPMRLAYFGPLVDSENDGNAGNCPLFSPYDADECWSDGDAGLMMPAAYTIDALLNYVPCSPPQTGSLGPVCTRAYWGLNVDIQVTNNSTSDRWVNVLMDWDHGGNWQGAQPCPIGVAPEHVLVNLWVPPGYSGPLSLLSPASFVIGPFSGFVWTRFTISESMVASGWDGSGIFNDGETCDYLLRVDQSTDVQEAVSDEATGTRLLPGQPNPFRGTTTLLLQLAKPGDVSVGIYDVAGRLVRTLLEEHKATGQYPITWDGRDDRGERLSSGIYFVHMRTGEKTYASRIVLMRS